MSIFDHLNKALGGHIFLSHSHDDIEQVRQIRNQLEQEGFEPLCFYLKCLSDDSEIEDLIKREIDAREWFVFINSENSRRSKWVNLEREYITHTNSKKIITVDLDDAQSVQNALEMITTGLRAFVSYAYKDVALASRIQRMLGQKDFLVYDLENIQAGDEWAESVANAIEDVAKSGIIIGLYTDNFLQSQWARNEMRYAADLGARIVPIIVGDTSLPPSQEFLLATRKRYYISAFPTDDELRQLVAQISLDTYNQSQNI